MNSYSKIALIYDVTSYHIIRSSFYIISLKIISNKYSYFSCTHRYIQKHSHYYIFEVI